MAYRIDPRLPLGDEVRRILGEELGGAVRVLREPGGDLADAIHEARKHLKKARALLRLLRPQLGEGFAWENGVCREAARLLAGARDARAMVEAARRLESASSIWSPVAERMAQRAEARAMPGEEQERLFASFEERVRGVDARLRSWRGLRSTVDLADGATRIFETGRRRFRRAIRRGDAVSVHAWRKRAKDLWYHARLVRGLDPLLAGWEACLDRLADALGQRHDLDVLEALLRAEPALMEGADPGTLMQEIQRRRRDLDREAALLGELVYEGGAIPAARSSLVASERQSDEP
ncbi:MAG TPA: CHAD domain-containing protein [Thermoanaerobaculia bacterium]|nr:CHAD domain-containing protein [Thermoanaerobaculia bacterium]